MAEQKYRVFVQRENEKGRTLGWRYARLKFDRTAQTLILEPMNVLLAKKWSAPIRPGDVDGFEILMLSDPSTLNLMYGGGLLSLGIAALMSRWAKTPVIKLSQVTGVPGMRWFHIRGTGYQHLKITRAAAAEMSNWLRESGYSGTLPDLDDKRFWKYPVVPTLVGAGLMIVAIIVMYLLIVVIVNAFY
jgi:hypothetical protein